MKFVKATNSGIDTDLGLGAQVYKISTEGCEVEDSVAVKLKEVFGHLVEVTDIIDAEVVTETAPVEATPTEEVAPVEEAPVEEVAPEVVEAPVAESTEAAPVEEKVEETAAESTDAEVA